MNISNNSLDDLDKFDPLEVKELENEFLDIQDPFNPRDIDIQVQQTTMSTLIDRLRHNEIDLNPDFQRTADLWNTKTKGRLIESLLVRFPIPAFYFDATDDDKWIVIDGLQRLTSIKKFIIDKSLILKNLEIVKEFENMSYDDLSRTYSRRIDQAPVTLYLIKPGTPKEVKYSLFYRINTGGLTLNPQEIRHALSQSINNSQASKTLQDLSDLPIFNECVRVSNRRMLDKELILRFIAFKLTNYTDYKEPMVKFLNETMDILGNLNDKEIYLLKTSFEVSLVLSWDLFGEDSFRKSILESNIKRKVVNRALFEVITTVLSNLNDDQRTQLKVNKLFFIEDFKKLLNFNLFHESISISTTYAKNIKLRFEEFTKIVIKWSK